MRYMLLTMMALLSVVSFGDVSEQDSQKLLSRVKDQADEVCAAYGDVWRSFYGLGHYKKLMVVSLDVRPDGTPNIVFHEEARNWDITFRLSVNEVNYKIWREAAHKRLDEVNMSCMFSDAEDTVVRVIGGKSYRFGENEGAAIERWEATNVTNVELIVRIRLMGEKGKVLQDDFIPLGRFKRVGHDFYCYPLYNLNRLSELPVSRYNWTTINGDRQGLIRSENAYAKVNYTLGKVDADALVDVKCEIMDADDGKFLVGDTLKKWQRALAEQKKLAEPKMAKAELRKERLEKMRRKTLSDAEIMKLLNRGYKPGKSTQLAASEEQLAYSLIKQAFEAKWDKPPWKETLRPMTLRVWFGNGGMVVRYQLESSSGDTRTDQTIKTAASRVGRISALPQGFIDKYKSSGIPVRFMVKPQ